jgi:glycosyltransferase involved in cell wall biosynthesis
MGATSRRLSVVVICKNEEDHLRDCLESVTWADEIVVVDSGSTDRTPAIARDYTDKVIHHDWQGYGAQKDFAMTQAGGDWILNVDADERVSLELADEIKALLRREQPRCNGYSVPRRTFYLGRWITHGGWYPDRKVRLVRRGFGSWGTRPVHEDLSVDGPVGKLRGDLLHFTYRDITDHVRVINEFTTLGAQKLYSEGRRRLLLHVLLNPPWKFVRMYVFQAGFLDGVPGLLVAILGSYYVFLKYAKLWQMKHVPARQGAGE